MILILVWVCSGGSGSGGGEGDMEMPFDKSDAEGEQSDNELDPEKGQGGSPDVNNMTNEELLEELEKVSDHDSPMGGVHGGVSEAITDKTFQDNLEQLSKKETNSYYEPEYVELPDLKMDTIIASNTDIHTYLDSWWNKSQQHYDKESSTKMDIFETVDNDYRLFRRSAQKEVNYLVKEFECRKSADAYGALWQKLVFLIVQSYIHTNTMKIYSKKSQCYPMVKIMD